MSTHYIHWSRVLEPIYSEYFGNYMYINEDGTKLLFDTDQPLPGIPKGDDVGHFVVWDVPNSTLLKHVVNVH